MAKGSGGGQPAKTGRNDNRASGKASKKNPKPNNYGANGKTKGGYSPAKLAARELKRKYTNVST
jgi:hypothetical protein